MALGAFYTLGCFLLFLFLLALAEKGEAGWDLCTIGEKFDVNFFGTITNSSSFLGLGTSLEYPHRHHS
jgi:hypothetical protein